MKHATPIVLKEHLQRTLLLVTLGQTDAQIHALHPTISIKSYEGHRKQLMNVYTTEGENRNMHLVVHRARENGQVTTLMEKYRVDYATLMDEAAKMPQKVVLA